jgi:hypothetical protein
LVVIEEGCSMDFVQTPGVTAERSGDRMLVLDPAGEVMTTLNPVGAMLWSWLPADLNSLVERLQAQFPDVQPFVLLDDTQQFLSELETAGLIAQAGTST